MGAGQVFGRCALTLDEVGHGIEPEAVDAQLEPEVHGLEDRRSDRAGGRS